MECYEKVRMKWIQKLKLENANSEYSAHMKKKEASENVMNEPSHNADRNE